MVSLCEVLKSAAALLKSLFKMASHRGIGYFQPQPVTPL